MQNITVTSLDRPDMDDILDCGERLLWSGEPGYGRLFLQPVGDERKVHIGLLIGAVVMWGTLPLIDPEARFGRNDAVWFYGAFTIAFIGFSFFLASQRQYVLQNLAYLITDRRAVICRRGRNWRFVLRLYVVSCPHSETFPFFGDFKSPLSIAPSRVATLWGSSAPLRIRAISSRPCNSLGADNLPNHT